MMKKAISVITLITLIAVMTVQRELAAQENSKRSILKETAADKDEADTIDEDEGPKGRDALAGDKSSDSDRPSFFFSVAIGALFYGVLGDRTIVDDLYKISFAPKSFRVGFSGGIEGYYFPAKRHSIAIGVFYEQRKIDLKITDFIIFAAFFPTVPFFNLISFPLDTFINQTTLVGQYFNIPVTYRFYFAEYFYTGLGIDIGVLYQAEAQYSVAFIDSSLDIKKKMQPVDLAGRVLIGFTMNRVIAEISVSGGFMDLDDYSGNRHSIYLKGVIGYMF